MLIFMSIILLPLFFSCSGEKDISDGDIEQEGEDQLEEEEAEISDTEDQEAENPLERFSWIDGAWTVEEGPESEAGKDYIATMYSKDHCHAQVWEIEEYSACISFARGLLSYFLVAETDATDEWQLYMGYPYVHDYTGNGSIDKATRTIIIDETVFTNVTTGETEERHWKLIKGTEGSAVRSR